MFFTRGSVARRFIMSLVLLLTAGALIFVLLSRTGHLSLVPFFTRYSLDTEIYHGLFNSTTARFDAYPKGNGGHIEMNPSGSSFSPGEKVTLTATPNSGFYFIEWEGDGSGSNNPVQVTMDTNKTVRAVFTRGLELGVFTRGEGQIIDTATGKPVPPGTYRPGTTLTVQAIPASGWTFVQWEGIEKIKDPSRTLQLTDEPENLVALFMQRTGAAELDLVDALAFTLKVCRIAESVDTFDRNHIASVNEDKTYLYDANGIPDAAEFALLQAVLQDFTLDFSAHSGVNSDIVWKDWEHNLNVAGLQLPPLIDSRLASTVAAYMTIGDHDSTCMISDLIKGLYPSISLRPEKYHNGSHRFFSVDEDVNNDGAGNLGAWNWLVEHKEEVAPPQEPKSFRAAYVKASLTDQHGKIDLSYAKRRETSASPIPLPPPVPLPPPIPVYPTQIAANLFHGEHVFFSSNIRKTPGGVPQITIWDPKTSLEESLLPNICGSINPIRSCKGELAFTKVEKDKKILSIIDTQGILKDISELSHYPEARSHVAWSPDGSKLLYGGLNLWGDGTSYGHAILYDPVTGKKEPIAEYVNDICWAPFDGAIYIQGNINSYSDVFKFDFKKHKLVKTSEKGVHFSPNGRYYYATFHDENPRFRLYRHTTNTSFSDKSNSPIPPQVTQYEDPQWITNRHLKVCPDNAFYTVNVGPSYLLNVENGEVRKTPNWICEGYEGEQVIVFNTQTDKFALEAISNMEIVHPNDLPAATPIGRTWPQMLNTIPMDSHLYFQTRFEKREGEENIPFIEAFDLEKRTGTPLIKFAENPVYSPRGWIAFKGISDIKGQKEHPLYLVNPQGKIEKITNEPTNLSMPFSRDGKYLAYESGIAYEGISVVYVYNLQTKQKTPLPLSNMYRTCWTSFDDNLYIMSFTPEVYSYNPKTQKLAKTPYLSNYFSTDGKYYFEKAYEEDNHLRMRLRKTNEEITYRPGSPIPAGAREYLEAYTWLDNKRLVCCSSHWPYKQEQRYYLLDIETGEIRWTTNFIDSLFKKDTVIIKDFKTDTLSLIPLSDMPIMKPEEWPTP